MSRLTPVLLALLLGLALAPAAGAQAPTPTPTPTPAPPPPPPPPPAEPRIASGMHVGGVDVSNLTIPEAAARLETELGPKLRRPVFVAVAKKRFRLRQKRMRFRFNATKSAERAFYRGQSGPPAPGQIRDVRPWYRVSKARIRTFARSLAPKVYRAPRNATVRITLTRIFHPRERIGRRLEVRKVRKRIARTVGNPAAKRTIRIGRRRIPAKVTAKALARRYQTIVTVDRSTFRLRLFKGYRVAKTYGVAVGAAGYDTPTGLYSITSRQVNPTWSAPDKPWAGLYRGRTVPGGSPENPLKARWLGIANGVGIHGTGDPGSIGSRASHGCIRMRVPDVIDLFPRVPLGAPVLIQ